MLIWLSLDTWLITFLSIGYLVLLFLVAYWGQKASNKKWASNPWVYSLSLGVSCTSWAFYGIIGQASSSGLWLAPIYIGTIACFVLAWPLLLKMLRVTKQQNLTSIADFIASRYERAPMIAGVVSLIALLGTIPYISLQLRAISQSFDLVTGSYQSGISTTFVVTIVLVVFSILFGARNVAINNQNQGLVFAIAFSSIVKLFAITLVGLFTTYYLFDGFTDLLNQQIPQQEALQSQLDDTQTAYFTVSQILLGMVTIFITPQLYHMMFIENNNESELKKARWLYPVYLLLINLFVLPIAIAGQVTFPGGSVNADTYILTLPLYHQQEWLSILVYIGGLAAATSMVIVAAIVLSTMLTTDIITPSLVKFKIFNLAQKTQLSRLLLTFRRAAIALVLLLSFLFERFVSQQSHLATLGLLAFVLLAQVSPAVIGALYWRKASSIAALSGLIVGGLLWVYTLFIPMVFPDSALVNHGMFNLAWLKPTSLFGFSYLDDVTHGVIVSLLVNTLVFIVVSLYSSRSIGEKLQAELFMKKHQGQFSYQLTIQDLFNLLHRFVNHDAATELIERSGIHRNRNQLAPQYLIDYSQKQLSSVLGSASTRLVMKAATSSDDDVNPMSLEQVANIVDEASELFQFNRELLQAGVENIEQGMSIIDADMRLVAWNKRYIELLGYPANFLQAGKHISELLKYNVQRGIINGNDADELINKRIEHMRSGNSHYYQRILPNGVVLEIRGQAMPGGGFVSTFTDITKHIAAEKALQQANETLEMRVIERTKELDHAMAEAEAANKSKTRFLAAASHDLMQPFNALALFTDMLKQQVKDTPSEQLADHIQNSLNVVEVLLSDLVEISKLDSSGQQPELSPFNINDVLEPLSHEITILAHQQQITFSYVHSSCWVNTDKRLIRRVIQNLLANAIHYSPLGNEQTGSTSDETKAKVLLGVRHHNNAIRIEVWDNGPGIPLEKQTLIFQEFERLESNRDKPGLGLGLAISDRIVKLLNLSMGIKSTLNKGSVFYVDIPRVVKKQNHEHDLKLAAQNNQNSDLSGLSVLLIDNDELMLTALTKQLQGWGCEVTAVSGLQGWQQHQVAHNNTAPFTPQLVIADYHLDNGDNGVDLVLELFKDNLWSAPCIVCSADPSEQLRQHCSDAQFSFIRKPVKALALKHLIKQVLS